MLVSKIKPCTSKYNLFKGNREWLIKSAAIYSVLKNYMDNCGNSRANTCTKVSTLAGRDAVIRPRPMSLGSTLW
jgi:hypothetical protein